MSLLEYASQIQYLMLRLELLISWVRVPILMLSPKFSCLEYGWCICKHQDFMINFGHVGCIFLGWYARVGKASREWHAEENDHRASWTGEACRCYLCCPSSCASGMGLIGRTQGVLKNLNQRYFRRWFLVMKNSHIIIYLKNGISRKNAKCI